MRGFGIQWFAIWLGAACALGTATAGAREPGTIFRDCDDCPEMVVIPAGRFFMGTTFDPKARYMLQSDEQPRHVVTIARPFALGRFEITQRQWQALMNTNPGRNKGPDLPVENLSFGAVVEFAKRLAKLTAQTYRLPTESEWEYAIRAGSDTEYWFGNDAKELGRHEWYLGNASKKPQPVGGKPANPFGLHDMAGNVAEWVADCFLEHKSSARTGLRDFRGTARGYEGKRGDGAANDDCASDAPRVFRGGAYYLDVLGVFRSASRFRGSMYGSEAAGVRIARSL